MEKADRKINTTNAQKYLPDQLVAMDKGQMAAIIELLYQLAAAYQQKN